MDANARLIIKHDILELLFSYSNACFRTYRCKLKTNKNHKQENVFLWRVIMFGWERTSSS